MIDRVFLIGRVQYGPGTALGPRDTIGYEFVRILKGNVRWTCDREHHDLGPGGMILSQPGGVEHYRWDPDGLTQHDYLHFYLAELPTGFPDPAGWARVRHTEPGDILHGLFQHILDLNRSGHPQAPAMITRAVRQMLDAWVFDLHRFEGPGFRDFSLPVQRVLDLVHGRWQRQVFRPPGLGEMTRAAQVSRSTLIRAFQQEVGQSPVRFFEQQRLHLGQLYLLETNRTVEEIAWVLGYANPFNFSGNFKHLFGEPPRRHRAGRPGSHAPPQRFAARKVFDVLCSTLAI